MICITGSLHIYTEGNFIYCTNRILQWPSKGRRDTQRRPVLVRNSSYPKSSKSSEGMRLLLGRPCPRPSWLLSSRASFSSFIAPPQCRQLRDRTPPRQRPAFPASGDLALRSGCIFFFKPLLPKRSRVLHWVNFKSLCGISGNRVLWWYFLDIMIF